MEQKIIPLTGYVLSASKYQDSDAVVNILTKDGIVIGNIRGGYSYTSKNHIGAQIFNLIEFDYNPKLKSIQQVKLVKDYTCLYEDIVTSLAGQVIVEASLKTLQKDDVVPFDYFEKSLEAIKEGFDPLTVCFIYLAQLSKVGGFMPELDGCLICGSQKNLVSFSFNEGGFICKNCAREENIPPTNKTYMQVVRYGYMITSDNLKHAALPKGELRRALVDLASLYNDAAGVNINSLKELLKESD